MSFKRTADGRVFFTGLNTPANETEADQPPLKSPLTGRILKPRPAEDEYTPAPAEPKPIAKTPTPAPKPAAPKGKTKGQVAAEQYQVVSLLKNLNEKLQLTQLERNSMKEELKAYQNMIADLEAKSHAQDAAVKALKDQLNDQPAAIAEVDTSALEATIKENRRLYEKLENRTERTDRSLNDLVEKAQAYREVSVSLSQKQAELERLQAQLEEDRSTYQQNYAEIKDRLTHNEETQAILTTQIKQSLEQDQQIKMMIEEDRSDRSRFMRKLERLEAGIAQIGQNQPLLEDPSPRHKDENGIEQGSGLHVPHYLVHKIAEEDEENLDHASLSEKLSHALQSSVTLPAPVLIAGISLLLAGSVWLSQTQFIQTVSVQPVQETAHVSPITRDITARPVAQSAPSIPAAAAPQAQTPIQSPQSPSEWQTTQETSAFIDPINAEQATPAVETAQQAAQIIAAAIKTPPANPNIPTQSQMEDLNAIMEVAPKAVGKSLNPIEPGTQAQDAPNFTAPSKTDIAAEIQASLTADQPNPALPQEFKELEQLAMQGVHDAQHDLAALYIVGHQNLAQDYERAAYWFGKAAEGGIANATYNMGVLYHQGLGVDADIAQAVRWYIAAADQGHAEAAYNLGIAYIEGVGVEYNPFKAAIHFEKAASSGTVEAAYNLGLIYENGLLGSAKPQEALMWYKIAADNGLSEAQTALAQLVKSLNIQYDEIDKIVSDTQKLYPNAQAPIQATQASFQAPSAEDSIGSLTQRVQEKLIDLDLYPGPVDGKLGPMTQDAISAYQKAYDLPITGQITPALYQHMVR